MVSVLTIWYVLYLIEFLSFATDLEKMLMIKKIMQCSFFSKKTLLKIVF